jgi:hypothetical protein
MATIGQTIDAEPSIAAQCLAIKRALVETVADAGLKAIDDQTLALLMVPVDLAFLQKFGGGITAHNTTRTNPASPRVGNFNVARVEEHLAAIDRQLIKLGGT